ncbi:GDP-L-fucose synthase family protein [Polyangium spumosum]|uniref:GDP-L-fucose synthase n=1 Tax=Polyangium spumosum TaxID=889282 RepID=A0A6N7Q3S7_9BACT|nr:NAD-dependent epimerase/dehydratase family protein [Polyangium spumosum]
MFPLTSSKILVTGGAGFLGSHVVEVLKARGAREVVVPRSSAFDLTDARAARSLFETVRPDLVLHLAARVGGIGANRRHPGTFFRDNMQMGLHVLEEARRAGTPKVLVAGTICAYPKYAPVPFREEDLWNGYPEETNAPYGIAKKALLVMAQAYRKEFGSKFVVVFPVNLYGPRDNFDLEDSHVIPAMIRKFVEARRSGEQTVTLWGDGSPTREFLYVEDAAEGLVLAAERYDGEEPVNLGAGREVSMRDLAGRIAQGCGYEGAIVWDTSRPNGQPRRMLDVTRAREWFGFEARTTLEEGLGKTIAWYEANRGRIVGS